MELSDLKKYFLGANSSDGFVNMFDESFRKDGSYAYIIKGGPGTGKSTLMKAAALHFMSLGEEVELYPCSSDPDSLDGIKIVDRKTVILDGTAPHTIDPKYPGVDGEILNIGALLNCERISNEKEKLLPLFNKNSEFHKEASKYIMAVGELADENLRISEEAANSEKIRKLADRYFKKYFPEKTGMGRENIRFLSGVTPKGYVFFKNSIDCYCDTVIGIKDGYGAFANEFLNNLRRNALSSGYEIITVKNSILPYKKTDAVIVPELSLAFCTENEFSSLPYTTKTIQASRYYDKKELKSKKQRTDFNNQMIRELLSSAISELSRAKSVHDEIEKVYLSSMDFKALDKFTSDFLRRLEKRDFL